MDCLGHIITNAGIHACADKMQKIRDWQQPHNFHKVQRFLGLVQYLAHFMPDVTAYTSPLTMCVRNGRQFIWTLLYDKCLESIKALACRAPILKPLTRATLTQSGSYAMAPSLESAPFMDRGRSGRHVAPRASCPRNSVLRSRTIVLMNMRRLQYSKLSLNGRINY